MKVPRNEIISGNESSRVQKFQLPFEDFQISIKGFFTISLEWGDEWRWRKLFITMGSLRSVFPV